MRVTCSVEGCGNNGKLKRGWCNRHYQNWRIYGNPTLSPANVLTAKPLRQCSVPDCQEGLVAKGYCGRHYSQVVVKGQEPGPRQHHSPLERDELGRKRCSVCKDWLPESAFYKFVRSGDGLERACKECKRARTALYRHKVTPVRYAERLARQGGCCPCGETDSLVVDHDHACCPGEYGCPKCFRGLLCHACNKAIGFGRDNPETLIKLAVYLENWEAQICA